MIKIGLLGAGHLGKIHLRLLKEIPAFDVVGFYDLNPLCAAEVEHMFGIKAYSDAESLMDACDAIDIVTPTISHFELAAKAIKKHKHAFIEKPLVTTQKEARTLLKLAVEANVKVQVGFVERFNPALITALPYINCPFFIDAQRISEFHIRGTDVSVVLDMMIHDIDIIMHIVKSPVKKVSATGAAVVSDGADIANARIEFDNGCIANITASRVALGKARKTHIFQHDSQILIDFLNKKVEVYHIEDYKGTLQPGAIIIGHPGRHQKQILVEQPQVSELNAIKTELEGFAKAIKENISPPVTIEQGVASMEVAFKILEHLKHNAQIYA
ncbi:MAG: Gfo/Idh/MocA family oxidoreductase [Flavobacteriales bacterium]|nr:Gfo/Idh/MocA family oxidoreductase [Flavobacteriales bacterium]